MSEIVSLKGKNTYTGSPIHRRLLQFIEEYNESKESKVDKIRCSRFHGSKALLYAYYNKFYNAQIKDWGDNNPEFLEGLSTNNKKFIEMLELEDKSTAYIAITFLSKVDIGGGRGKFLTKTNHGRYQNYTIHFNPYFLTGQVVENWGTFEQKKWVKPEINPETKNQKYVKTLSSPTLIENFNLSSIAGTNNNIIYNTTTNPCDYVEDVNVSEQVQETGTKESGQLNPLLAKFLAHKGIKTELPQTGGAAENLRSETIKSKYFGTSTRTDIQSSSLEKGKKEPQIQPNQPTEYQLRRQKAVNTTLEFYKFAMQTLYPNFKVWKEQQQRNLLNTIYLNWFDFHVKNPLCTVEFFDSHLETLKEAVIISLQEAENKPKSYIVADPMKYFDREKFKFGLNRSMAQLAQRHQNNDRKVLRKAQISLMTGKVPRNIKMVMSIPALVQYWKDHINRVCLNKELMLRQLNIFLTDPKNLCKNGIKL